MMLSVMVVGAGAAFSDQSKIKNTEAVDACTALNIIGGYPDGSFKPEGNITRAEVTKMICVALNGGKNPAVSTNTTPTFSDVRNNANAAWAEGYIESCAAQGIVSGVGGGKFAPNGNVTGVQLAKMLLVSLGYKSENEGFTGNAWATNVNVRAAQKGLYVGLESMDTNAAITRDNAAQMVWNALQAYEVEYKTNLVADKDGKLSTQITVQDKVGIDNKTKITLLNDKYDTDTKEDGILTYVKEDNKGTYTVKTRLDGKTVTYTKVAKDYSDLMGQKVDILVKTDDNSKVYGIYANEDTAVIASGYVGSLELDGSNKVKLNGTSYKLDSDSNSIAITRTANTDAALITFKSLADKVVKGNVDKNVAASTIKLIDNNGDGKIDTAVYTPVKVGKVTSVSKSAVTVNNGINTVKFEDADIYSGIAKDDYVQFVDETYRSAKDKDSITKLTVASNKVNGVRTQSIKNVEAKADSTWVKLASDVTVENGSTYDMVIVGDVLLFADETAASSKDILYVSGTKAFENFVGEDKGTVEIRAYFTNGSDKKVTVSKYDGEKLTSATQSKVAAQALYTYSALSDGTYDIKALDSNNKAGYDTIGSVTKGATAYSKQKINNYAPTDDAAIFVQTKNETKVISGKQLKNWADSISATFTTTYALNEKDGINYVGVATLVDTSFDKNVPGASKDTKYGYLVSDAYSGYMEGEDGKKATYEVWTNEGAKTLYADEATAKSGALAGKVISYSESGKYIDDITVVGTEVAITGFDYKVKGELAFTSTAEVKAGSTTLIKKGAQQITLDEDCVFIGMNDADTAGVENAGMAQVLLANPGDNSTSSNETVLTNAYIVVGGDDNKVMAVIFDADKNELDNAKEIYKKSGDVYSAPAAPTYTASISSSITKPSDTVVVGLSKNTGLKAGDKVTVTLTKNDGNTFGAGTYGIQVTGATAPATKAVAAGATSITFDITVASSNIVVTAVTKA